MKSNYLRYSMLAILLFASAFIPAKGLIRNLLMWSSISASVNSFDIISTKTYRARGGSATFSHIAIEYYFYTKNGDRYDITSEYSLKHNSETKSFLQAANSGNIVPIYFNPFNPNLSTVAPDRNISFYAFALVFVLLANLLIWYVSYFWFSLGRTSN